ncbi:glycosyltransferase [Lithospermum erythrorhizon]|uniref:Glycosyltransferase n=1 Tax=Lithospermum erythrorhizon TaxID=34254 RepID=A0AAV3RQZ0_LITER
MEEVSSTAIEGKKYRYIRDVSMGAPEVIDIHHIILKKNARKGRVFFMLTAVLLVPATFLTFSVQGNSVAITLLFGLLIGGCLTRKIKGKQVTKESVVILPGFGLQLETHYQSGRTMRLFVPVNKILKPVLNECVTPVTCYWVLALILRDEGELQLVFKDLRPPVKMLVPVWKALCAATEFGDHISAAL